MIQRGIRHSKRYREIVNVFIKNGLSHLLYRIGLTDNTLKTATTDEKNINNNLMHLGTKLRLSLQELGPTFIKLGQIASTRRDLIPEEVAFELEKLQDDVLGFSCEEVEEIFQEEFDKTTREVFQDFSPTPIATASIGQVHFARLESGEEVAIKIQRPNIQASIETDLDILFHIGRLIEDKTKWGKNYQILSVSDEFSTSHRNELDYLTEGRNADKMRKQCAANKTVHIPEIHWEYTSRKVLTMEKVSGIKVSQITQLKEHGYDLPLLANRIAESLFSQVLEHGFFHGDPHPGNIFILPRNIISYVDFGMVGRLNDQMQSQFSSLLIAVYQNSPDEMIQTFEEMNLLDRVDDIDALHRELDKLLQTYYDVSLTDISLGKLLIDIFALAYRHQMDVPTDITVLAKAIVTAEEVIEKLDPTFSIMAAVEPFAIKILQERLRPQNLLKSALKDSLDNVKILRSLPKDIQQTAKTVSKGRLKVNVHVEDAPTFLQRLDRISNRLSFSIILLAFSILMVGLIIGASIAGETNTLFKLPVIELGGIVAFLMFVFMLFSIFRSGRM